MDRLHHRGALLDLVELVARAPDVGVRAVRGQVAVRIIAEAGAVELGLRIVGIVRGAEPPADWKSSHHDRCLC